MTARSSQADQVPLMERPEVAILLAVAAGIMSGFTFYTVHLFSTVQSGNVVQAGYQLAVGSGVQWNHAVLAILAFGAGSATTAVIQSVFQHVATDYSLVILCLEVVVLLLMGSSLLSDRWSPLTYAYVVSFLAGMQGNAFHKINGTLYGNVAVTLVVQMAFSHLMQAAIGDRRLHLVQSALFFLVLTGFAGGGFIGAWGAQKYDQRSLWLAAFVLALLAMWAFVRQSRGEQVDIPV